MRDEAIDNALNYKEGKSYSDGNMVVGVSDTYIAVAFNNTPDNENTLVILMRSDALALATLIQTTLTENPR